MSVKHMIILSVIFIVAAVAAEAQISEREKEVQHPDGPVYLMISYDIVNLTEWQKYPPLVRPLLKKYGAEVLTMDTQAFALEGAPHTMHAIIKFPSREAAINCYNDPEYQPAKKIRISSTKNASLVLAKHLLTP
ncbi:hypothetical protein WSM22_08510 [Cytophagales bacterium WSM2-2]|nr:hypothetical protein WSM22_08510 [Cytophagales bacterium WSM2-2]